MLKLVKNIRRRLALKLILTVGLILLITLSTYAYFNVNYQKKTLMQNIIAGTDRLTNTIRLGTHYAMMLNSRDDINQIINNIARQEDIQTIRIYNKEGQIKFSNQALEVDQTTNIKTEACYICHKTEPPLAEVALEERTRIFTSPQGDRLLGIISPIRNETGCATDTCHVHPADKQILGALDVVVSLKEADKAILLSKNGMIGLTAFAFLLISTIIFLFVLRFVNQPIRKLIEGTRQIARGVHPGDVQVNQEDEMGHLARAINQMSQDIEEKQAKLNRQKVEYQTLFEQVPCFITVQDRDFRLLQYNREFAENFAPRPGDFCFHAYKGRDEKCPNCPVEKTFEDGLLHFGEQSGLNRDGSEAHWLFTTSPIRDEKGDIVAAMEMSLDITERKQLEEDLEKSEKKYHEIFNNIPNPVFVLDIESLEIIDCNDSVKTVYGYDKQDVIDKSFLDLFPEGEKGRYAERLRNSAIITQAKQLNHLGLPLFVNIRVSPAEYPGRKVLLITTSDITKRLEAEQQLIQASKMATLGEMATGIAHELNQPLSVMKTASSFFMRKIEKGQALDTDTLFEVLQKIDSNVDRASKIINHMRQFARKSDMEFEKVQVNEVLQRAFEIFSQQLKLREIDVLWDIDPKLPKIQADPSRLEQVFINLLLNARDAIEESMELPAGENNGERKISIQSSCDGQYVICQVCDSGKGVPPSLANKIFEPFFTTKEVGKGTGLGLSISYGIIKDCGGEIRVIPNKPQGACFVVKFPVPEKKDGKENSTG